MARHTRKSCPGDPAHGCPPDERPLRQHVDRGVVVLDKPAGLTSRQSAEKVRRALGARKVGHGGTLDPKVTGVLPVLLGRATRAAAVLIGCDKEYEGELVLHGDVPDGDLAAGVQHFQGVIEQLPPVRSRVKREWREREIHEFRITGREGRRARFVVRCQGGTYVRKLVHDLGQHLGCGAHMGPLRRTHAGPFDLSEAVTPAEVEGAAASARGGDEAALRRLCRPVEEAVAAVLPCVVIDDGAVHAVCHGQPLAVPGVCALDEFEGGDRVAVLSAKGELVGFGDARMGWREMTEAVRGLAVTVDAVLMPAGTYPRV